jgi:ADP-heptose:LPS heptosyltransferase
MRLAAHAGLAPADVAAGRTDAAALVGIIAGAGRIVSGDTGVAHLATALRTPSVVLFGPTPPAQWGPPPDRPWHIALWTGRCGDPHADRTDPGLLEITVVDVLHAIDRLPPRAFPEPIAS